MGPGRLTRPSGSGLLRTLAKHIAEQALLHGSAPFIRPNGVRLILAYHNVVPDELAGIGDASLHLPVSSFRAQLALLRTHCDVVPLGDLLDPRPGTRRPRVAITFDDAYRGAVELGLGELRRAALPATVFVAPGLLGQGPAWWDVLASSSNGWDDAVRERAIMECRGDAVAVRATFGLDGADAALPALIHIATGDELLRAARDGGFALASHTWSHRNVATLSEQELREEYRMPLAWLSSMQASFLPWIAYPYGRYSAAATAAARDAGYAAGVRVDGGRLSAGGDDRFTLPRLNVPAGVSAAGFELRVRGVIDGRVTRGGS